MRNHVLLGPRRALSGVAALAILRPAAGLGCWLFRTLLSWTRRRAPVRFAIPDCPFRL